MSAIWLSKIALTAYLVVLSIICIYGLHRLFLVVLFYRVKRKAPQLTASFRELPFVTVQLPMYNERLVARRVIEQACRIDYPRDRLEIQVLDDSIDDTVEVARQTVERLRGEGHNIDYLHRDDRVGYKAGALEAGARVARGEFIVIFDADFLPPPQMVRETIHYFTDERVGMVQTRWEHLNRGASLLTETQAILLDGHFIIEHTARNRSGRYMAFNGTAGIWRKAAIVDSGGWQHDTLTEDLDLSYRAQLRGWQFVFLPSVTSPAELPPEMSAFKAQQHRWTKGGAQSCVKLLPTVMRRAANWRIKLEAFFHLTSGFVYILMVLLTLLIGPALYAKLVIQDPTPRWKLALEMLLFFIGFGAPLSFYIASQREQFRSWFDSLRYVPALMAVGIGIGFNNAVAALDGFFGKTGEFVRTPKYGEYGSKPGARPPRPRFHLSGSWKAWAELGIALYLTAYLIAFFFHPNWYTRVSAAIPFLLMFILGYFYVAYHSFCRSSPAEREQPAAAA